MRRRRRRRSLRTRRRTRRTTTNPWVTVVSVGAPPLLTGHLLNAKDLASQGYVCQLASERLFTVRPRKKNKQQQPSSSRPKSLKSKSKKPSASKQRTGPSSPADIEELVRRSNSRGRSLNYDVITLPVSFTCRRVPTSDSLLLWSSCSSCRRARAPSPD